LNRRRRRKSNKNIFAARAERRANNGSAECFASF